MASKGASPLGTYEIDLVQQGLRRGGSVVTIEPRCSLCLAYLVQNRDRRAAPGRTASANTRSW